MLRKRERRRSSRVSDSFTLHYRMIPAAGTAYLDARVEDLSADGVRFRAPGAIRVRSGLLFELMLPGERPVHTFGRASWVRELPESGGFEVGGWFVDQSTAARRTIERHLRALPGTSET